MPTVETLKALSLWGGIEPHTAPLKTMRLIDGSKRLVRSPVADFNANEIDLEAFGYNVPNALMIANMEKAIAENPSIVRFDGLLSESSISEDDVTLTLDSGEQLTSKLAVAADGRNSILRTSASIDVKEWSYPQTALVLTFGHTLPHNSVSAEFHTETGPFTQVPLPATSEHKNRSSLVWVVDPEDAETLINTDLADLSLQIEQKLQSSFGKCFVENKPGSIPMKGMTAKSFGANRVVLVGESGHVFPPIGAQGFNLGMRDVNDLCTCLHHSDDPGSHAVTLDYHRKRVSDVHLRTMGVDVMNRSLLTDFLPVQLARTVGISALKNVSSLRRFAMQQGLGNPARMKSPLDLISRLTRREKVGG